MTLTIVESERMPRQRWRNGGGWTREFLAWPPGFEWIVRVSVADIETSGPFSEFPGVDRSFAVVAGNGVTLQSAGEAPARITVGHPMHTFSGDVLTTCDLIDGPVRDLNLMVRQARATAVVRDVAVSLTLAGNAWWVGLFVTTACTMALDDGPTIEVPALGLSWIDNPDRAPYALRVADGPARGWWIEVCPRSPAFLTSRDAAE